jgi:hypothetical protein
VSDTARIDRLVAQFNGAIKYASMLQDHPDWTDEQCLALAREGHAKAIAGLKRAIQIERNGFEPVERQVPRWNNRISYCRNLPTPEMLKEAS